jgi:multidrug transporter EmrE-like cation transporter
MNEISFRNVWVSLAIMLPIGFVGLFLLREHPEAKGWLVLGIIAAGIALRHYLDRHEFDGPQDD